MWDEYENDLGEFEPTDSYANAAEEKDDRRWRIIAFLIAVVAILGMMGSGIAGLSWLFTREAARNGAAEPEAVVIDVTATSDASADEENDATKTAVSPATPPPTLDERELTVNRIVFVNGEGQVGTVNPDGEEQRLLTNTSRRFQFPAWSPDGRRLAAIASERGGAAIYVMTDEADSEPASVYSSSTESPFYLYWAPDSEQISFLANHPDAPMALHLVPASGGESRMVSTGGPFYWDWAADSRQILIHTGFSGAEASLALVDAESIEIEDDIAPPGYFQAPGISADGRFWAYAEVAAGGNSRIVVASAEDGKKFRERHSGIAVLGWSPTENKLAYVSSAEADGDGFFGPLRLMDAETGEVTLLSRERVLAYFWSPDGRYIAYLSLTNRNDNEINAGLFPKETGGKAPGVAKIARQRRLPTFNLSIIDVETGAGRVVLTGFQPSLLFISQFLPFFDQYALSHQIWSPASDALVLPIVENGRSQIFVVPTNGGQKRLIADGTVAFWSRQ